MKHELTIKLSGDAMVMLHESGRYHGLTMEQVAANIIETHTTVGRANRRRIEDAKKESEDSMRLTEAGRNWSDKDAEAGIKPPSQMLTDEANQ